MKKLNQLKASICKIFVIHYSCENLSDQNESLSPRITSIAVQHLESKTNYSFAVHLIAERLHVARIDIESHYDEIERELLIKFSEFVQAHPSIYWLHWNMGSAHYGFGHIAHRYSVLTNNEFPNIQITNIFDLSDLLKEKYGKDYVDHPRMQKLMELNDGTHPDYLTGENEVQAFRNREFVRMHRSTIHKTHFFSKVFELLLSNKLITQRSNRREKINRFMEHSVVKIITGIATLVTLSQGINWGINLITKSPPKTVQTPSQEKSIQIRNNNNN